MSDTRPLATVREVADYLRVPVATLYDWRVRGKGPRARRIGKHLRYDWADIESYDEQGCEAVASAS